MAATNGVAFGDTSNTTVSPSTFSYAQAAKGKTTVTASPVLPANTPSMSSKPSKDSISGPSHHSVPENKLSWADDAADDSTVVDDQAQAEQALVNEVKGEASTTLTNGTKEEEGSSTSSPDFPATNSSSTVKEEAHVQAFVDPEILSWRKRPQDTEPAPEPWSATGPPAKGEEEGSKVEPPLQKHLVEAPVPVFNVWAQRASATKPKHPNVPPISVPKNDATSAPTTSVSGASPSQTSTSNSQTQSAIGPPPGRGSAEDAPNRRASYPRINGTNSMQRGRNAGPNGSSQDSRPTRNSAGSTSNRAAAAPLRDVQLWPTPDFAQDKDKQKVQEKTEKSEERASTSARKADKWEKVDFTPTVKFETPLPSLGARRGGKAGTRGGRDAGGRAALAQVPQKGTPATTSSSTTGETKVPQSNSEPSAPQAALSPERRNTVRNSDANESQAASVKRSSVQSEQAAPTRHFEQRNRPRQLNSAPTSAVDPNSAFDVPVLSHNGDARSRLPSNAVEPVVHQDVVGQQPLQDSRPRRKNSRVGDMDSPALRNGERRRSGSINGSNKSFSYERRADTFPRHYEPRDLPPISTQRDRGDRNERARGNRMRGGPASQMPPMLQQVSNGPMSPSGPSVSTRSATFQQGFSPAYTGQRPMRGNAHRPVSMPSEAAYSRYGSVYPSTPQFTPYSNGSFDYNSAPQMSPATQYNPYMSQMMLLNGVAAQLNYYFSVDNLCKDMFLRQHMDSQGFVALKFIADFARMKVLTTDLDVVRTVAEQSPDYYLQRSADGQLLIRKSIGWEKFVLAMKDRDVSARHDGPPIPAPVERAMDHNTFNGQSSPATATAFTPISSTATKEQRAAVVSASPTSTPAGDHDAPARAPENDRYPTQAQVTQTSEQPIDQSSLTDVEASKVLEEPDTFPDDKIDHLTVVVRARAPFHTEWSRSFSNGSLDGYNAGTNGGPPDERQSRSLVRSNGPDQDNLNNRLADIKRNLTSPSSSHKRVPSNTSVGLFWIKEQGEESEHLPPNSTYEPYGQVCANATEQRRSAAPGHCPYDMSLLYQFWSHFLLRNFNSRMYVDFRTFAHEDLAKASHVGMDNLMKYYGESLLSSRTIRRLVAQDYLHLVKNEARDGDRPGFKQLRATWRNGAFNMKNRKIVSQLADEELRTELDR